MHVFQRPAFLPDLTLLHRDSHLPPWNRGHGRTNRRTIHGEELIQSVLTAAQIEL
jgi:hypothetical protein